MLYKAGEKIIYAYKINMGKTDMFDEGNQNPYS